MSSALQRVCEMNVAFGNPAGKPDNINWNVIRSQIKNILDEYNELVLATEQEDVEQTRDALMDIVVFAAGATHLMGYSPDADLHAVVSGVLTRFVKSPADLQATLAILAKKGITDVTIEGQYPTMVVRSNSDQPDAPKGKFLKSASYTAQVLPPPPGN